MTGESSKQPTARTKKRAPKRKGEAAEKAISRHGERLLLPIDYPEGDPRGDRKSGEEIWDTKDLSGENAVPLCKRLQHGSENQNLDNDEIVSKANYWFMIKYPTNTINFAPIKEARHDQKQTVRLRLYMRVRDSQGESLEVPTLTEMRALFNIETVFVKETLVDPAVNKKLSDNKFHTMSEKVPDHDGDDDGLKPKKPRVVVESRPVESGEVTITRFVRDIAKGEFFGFRLIGSFFIEIPVSPLPLSSKDKLERYRVGFYLVYGLKYERLTRKVITTRWTFRKVGYGDGDDLKKDKDAPPTEGAASKRQRASTSSADKTTRTLTKAESKRQRLIPAKEEAIYKDIEGEGEDLEGKQFIPIFYGDLEFK